MNTTDLKLRAAARDWAQRIAAGLEQPLVIRVPVHTRRWTPVTMATLEADAHETARVPREAHRPLGWKRWHMRRTVRDFATIRATLED